MASSCLNQSRDDRRNKTRPQNKPSDHPTHQSGRPEQKHTWVTGKYIPRGERDVTRLRNPTKDKRAFRRMLTSAKRLLKLEQNAKTTFLQHESSLFHVNSSKLDF